MYSKQFKIGLFSSYIILIVFVHCKRAFNIRLTKQYDFDGSPMFHVLFYDRDRLQCFNRYRRMFVQLIRIFLKVILELKEKFYCKTSPGVEISIVKEILLLMLIVCYAACDHLLLSWFCYYPDLIHKNLNGVWQVGDENRIRHNMMHDERALEKAIRRYT